MRRSLLLTVLLSGCSSAADPSTEPPPGETPVETPTAEVSSPTYLDDPQGALPTSLAELGLYPDIRDRTRVHPRAIAYRPRHELWSNGSDKHRYLVLPEGTNIDTSDRSSWKFPDGTLFFKTFSYAIEAGVSRPIETRVLALREGKWDYFVYLWDEAGESAALADLTLPKPVEVTFAGETFEHVVPARLDCRKCHESQPVNVIGFDELRLNAPSNEGEATQLDDLFAEGILSTLPGDPRMSIAHDDALTGDVLGYLHGNCAHCHNGTGLGSSAFDLRYPVALENLIGRETEGNSIAGIRVVPGNSEQSALFQVISRKDFANVQPMPPIGVQRVDSAAVQLIKTWIDSLTPEHMPE